MVDELQRAPAENLKLALVHGTNLAKTNDHTPQRMNKDSACETHDPGFKDRRHGPESTR